MSDVIITTGEVRDFLSRIQGQEISLDKLRSELGIERHTKSFDSIRNIMFQLTESKIVRPTKRGLYKVITQVTPVPVFSVERERRPVFDLIFPRDFDKGMQMDFAESIVIREGDLITLGGVKSKGKTLLCLNFCAENINQNPVLMGNEYTVLVEDKYEPAPRFLLRLDKMKEWVEWTDSEGKDKFTLLPVRDDYAEHIVRNKLNIIDWINIDAGKLYDIGTILEGIKKNLGRGVGIAALQKSEYADNPRGGQFVRDFSDLEILLDGFGSNDDDILLTIKGAKEKTKPVVGKTYAYTIGGSGTQILDFREVKKCSTCHASGYVKGVKCDVCNGTKYVSA